MSAEKRRHIRNPMAREAANWGITDKQRAALVGSFIDRQWWEGIIQDQYGGGIDTSDKTWLVVIARKGPANWNIHEFQRAYNYLKRFNGFWVDHAWRSQGGFTWEMFMVELDVLCPEIPEAQAAQRKSPLVAIDHDDDDDPDYVDLDPPEPESEPEPVTRRGKRSRYVALTQKNADALYWVAEFTPNGGITSGALGKKLGIGQSGAFTRIAKLMEKGLVTWAPGAKETYVVSEFWYEAEVVVS